MNRIIITGGNGFIGRHLIRKLITCKPSSIVLISNNPVKDSNLEEVDSSDIVPITCHTADVRNPKIISDIFMDEKPNTCIHLAAKISVADSIRNPQETLDINEKGTLNVLEACQASNTSNFILASSAAVYGDVDQLPIPEDHRLEPLSPYGLSKMLAERHVFSYSKLNKIKNSVSLRIFNVYGEGQSSESDVITRFTARLSKGLPPVIHGSGRQTRDFISVDDVAQAMIQSIKVMEATDKTNIFATPAVFNIGTGIPTSIEELAKKMIRIFGLDIQPTYEEESEDNMAILHSYADIAKSKKILHFVPAKTLEEGLRELIGPFLLGK